MKIRFFKNEQASVLITALMTITILTMLCATSLYIISQNGTSGMAVASWQQALSAAESGVYAAVAALNEAQTIGQSAWQTPNWYSVNTALPTPSPAASATPIKLAGYSYEPSGGTQATAPPTASQYNYLPSSGTLNISFPNSEGITGVTAWVTIDQAGMSGSPQWYRVRSTGQAKTSGPPRVSNNRLDNDLRNTIALNSNRKGGSYVGATRTIEVILRPLNSNLWGEGIYVRNTLTISGGNGIDYFNSNTTPTATFLTAPSTYRGTNDNTMVMGLLNANGSNLGNANVYGEVAYSTTGSAPSGTSNVKGGLTSPFNSTPPTTSDPAWATTGTTPDFTYTTNGAAIGSTTITPGTGNNSSANPYKVKVAGGLKMITGNTVNINYPAGGNPTGATPPPTYYVEIWVTSGGGVSGDFTQLGGTINIAPGVHVTTYVDGSFGTYAAGTINNTGGVAANNQIVVVGSGAVSVNAGGLFCGTIEAPNSTFSLTGGTYVGAIIANTMNYLGGTFHYDAGLASATGSSSIGNYAFASWFEDNSDPTRNYSQYANANNLLTPIVY